MYLHYFHACFCSVTIDPHFEEPVKAERHLDSFFSLSFLFPRHICIGRSVTEYRSSVAA